MTKSEEQATIAALLEERRGYVLRGLDERVAAVDARLRDLGAQAEKPQSRSEKRPSGRLKAER